MATRVVELAPELARMVSGSNFPQLVDNGTTRPYPGLAYDGSTSEAAHWRWSAIDYGSGDLTVTIVWYAASATSGSVVWEVAIGAITPNADTTDPEAKGYATGATATDTHLGSVGKRLHSVDVTVTGSSLDSLATGDDVSIRIARLPAHPSDTMAGDAVLTMAILSYSDT